MLVAIAREKRKSERRSSDQNIDVEMAAEAKQKKKRPITQLTGDEHEEEADGNKRRPRTQLGELEGNKCSCAALAAAEETSRCQDQEKWTTETTRTRYPQEHVDYILSWNPDFKIPELPIDDDMTEEQRGMHLYAMDYFRELRGRKRALQEWVKAQVADRGYAEMPHEKAQPPKKYDEDGEELAYLGFGMYDD
jgi:hypothetical protein